MSAIEFDNYGRIAQMRIDSPDDLERIESLDKARWAATSAPIDQLLCDPEFLRYADTDGNRRIRVNELVAAQRWLWARLKDRSRLMERSEELLLDHLDLTNEDARKVKHLADLLLTQLDAPARDRIRLDQVRHFRGFYARRFPNGDGIVTPAQIPDAEVEGLAKAVIACTGGAPDLSGDAGVRAADIDLYVDRATRFIAWSARSTGLDAATILPFGADTAAAADLVRALGPKVTQFFAQCALVSLETNAVARLQATPEQLAKLDISDPAAIDAWLAVAPLARPTAEPVLPLQGPVNPRYATDLSRLAREVAPRVLVRSEPLAELTPVEWATIVAHFEPFLAWRAARPEGIAADAAPDALLASVKSPGLTRLRELVAQDSSVADELVEFNNLERLILYHRWLFELANNFVSFPALFDPKARCLFEMGTLVLDGRKLSLCMRVTDLAAHKKLAETSLMFLAYVELTRKDGDKDQKDLVAAAVTAGVRGGIGVGKRGVFYDRDNREWDALVVDVVQQPISVWEAMIAPFSRLRDNIASRIEKMLGAEAAEMETRAVAKTETLPPAKPAAPPPEKPPAQASGNMQGLLVGGGVAFAAIGSSMAFVAKTISDIDPVDALLSLGTIAGLMAAVFGLIGWLKLRRRDVSALLEACGWALNGRMRLTHRLSLLFTDKPGIPKGSVTHHRMPVERGPILVAATVILAIGGLGWVAYAHPTWIGLAHEEAATGGAAAEPAVAAPAPAAPAP